MTPAEDDSPRLVAAEAGVVAGRDVYLQGRYVAGRDLHINVDDSYPRLAYRQEIAPLVSFLTQVFVGREHELRRLSEFAAQPPPSYLLIEAPPGFGKSALVAQLLHRYEGKREQGHPSWNLVYFFIREEGRRHSPEAFCTAVNSQLLDLLGDAGGVPSDLERQRGQLLHLWTRAVEAARADRPLLLVVDGLDEMAHSEVTIAQLLPARLGPFVHVVVTSRPSPEPLAQVALEHPLRQAQVLRLRSLTLNDIEALLARRGGATGPTSGLAQRLLEITRGEPLLARFVSQDVVVGGEPVLAGLERNRPTGIKDYFHKQLEQLEARAKEDIAWDVLGLLLVAHGAMTTKEASAVLKAPLRRVRSAIAPLQRFLLGPEQLELMHLELRAVLAEQFGPAESQAYRDRLLAWCRGFAEAGWPDEIPDYVLEHYAAHLREVGDSESLYRLIGRRWMQLKAARSRSHRAFAQDVLFAIEAADAEDPPNLVQNIRASLIYATLGSVATNVDPKVLVALAQVGDPARAEGYASLSGASNRCNTYVQIAGVLVGQREHDALALLDRALATAQVVEDDLGRARALANVSAAFAAIDRTQEAGTAAAMALAAAQAVEQDEAAFEEFPKVIRALVRAGRGLEAIEVAQITIHDGWTDPFQLLGEAAGSIVKAGRAEEALRIASAVQPGWSRITVLGEVVNALAEAGEEDKAQVAVDALAAARADERSFDPYLLDEALTQAAEALAKAGWMDQALRIIQAIEDYESNVVAVSKVTRTLADAGHVDKALEVVRRIEYPPERVRVLGMLAKMLAGAGLWEAAQLELHKALADALTGREEASDGWSDWFREESDSMLGEVARASAQAGRVEEALQTSQAIMDDWERAATRRDVAWALAESGYTDEAIRIALSLAEAGDRAFALARGAEALASAGHHNEARGFARSAVSAAATMRDTARRTQTLIHAAGALSLTGPEHEALEAIRGIDGLEGTRSLVGMAKQYIMSGKVDEAFRIAESLNNNSGVEWAVASVVQAFAAAGRGGEALRLANRLKDRLSKDRALAQSAETLANAGRADEALLLAQAVESKFERAETFIRVARALAEQGRGQDACRAAVAIEIGWKKGKAFGEVAEALVVAGHQDAARIAVEQAITAAEAISDAAQRAPVLGKLAAELANGGWHRVGQVMAGRALAVAEAVEDNHVRARLLTAIASAFAKAGQGSRARQVANAIDLDFRKVPALGEVAAALWVVGQAGEAQAAVEEAHVAAQAMTNDEYKADALAEVAKALATAGQSEEARLAAARALVAARAVKVSPWDPGAGRGINPKVVEALALAGEREAAVSVARQAIASRGAVASVNAATALAAAGLCQEALGIAQTIAADSGSAWALADIAEALGDAGCSIEAGMVAGQALAIADASRVGGTLASVARALGAAGRADEAARAAETIEDPDDRRRALAHAAKAYATGGQVNEAVAVAQAIGDRVGRTAAIGQVAIVLAEAGRGADAMRVAQTIKEDWKRNEVLGETAATLAAAGHGDQALHAAQVVSDPGLRATALARAAAALAATERWNESLDAAQQSLATARTGRRSTVFEVLEQILPVLISFDGGRHVPSLAQTLLELEAWWGRPLSAPDR
jgi:hypothetical protein